MKLILPTIAIAFAGLYYLSRTRHLKFEVEAEMEKEEPATTVENDGTDLTTPPQG